MLFTAVISIFISELLSDTACPEFITQSPCIMHGNPLLRCHSDCAVPAASHEFVHTLQQLPRDRSQQPRKALRTFKMPVFRFQEKCSYYSQWPHKSSGHQSVVHLWVGKA